jgi:hypothetical protein
LEKKPLVKLTAEQLTKQMRDSETKKEQQTAGLQSPVLSSLSKTAPFIVSGEAERKTGFWKKIKDILVEKELPAGHPFPVKELELPARVGQRPKLEVPKPKYQEASIKKQELSIKNQEAEIRIQEAGIKKQEIRDKNYELGNREQATGNRQQGTNADTASSSKILYKPQAEQAPSVKLENLFKPKVKLEEIRSDAKSGEQPSTVIKQVTPAPIAEAGRKKDALGAISMQSLANIGLYDFVQSDVESIAKKIKPLIRLNGYHNVIFSLEKSPLFKAYIDTGIKVLSQQTGFGKASGGLSTITMKQEDFEKFTDLLMELQA